MTINELITKAHQQAKDKGFWDKERNTSELLMLIVSECGEAMEAHRNDRLANLKSFNIELRPTMYFLDASGAIGHRLKESESPCFNEVFCKYIKDTFEDELADIVIRIADFMGSTSSIPPGSLHDTDSMPDNVGEALMDVAELIAMASIAIRKKEAYLSILCSAISHVAGIAENNNIDLIRHIELKMAYNATRPRLHGKAY